MAFSFNPTDSNFSFNPDELADVTPYIPTCINQPTGDQITYNNWLKEIVNLYGIEIRYYPHSFSLSEMHSIFGEDMSSGFASDLTFKAYVEVNSNSNILSRFGIKTDAEVSVSIPFDTWDLYFPDAEPKAGDIFVIVNTGCGRKGDRTAEVFEITKRLDRKNPGGDFLGRHYAWFLEAARFEYAYEPGAPPEANSTDVSDEELFGLVQGAHVDGDMPSADSKGYEQSTNAISDNIKQYSDNRDSVFGNY